MVILPKGRSRHGSAQTLNHWGPMSSRFQSLRWPTTSPTGLGSHTHMPFTPRQWPYSSHSGLLAVHHRHPPGSHCLDGSHPGILWLTSALTSSARASLIAPHPASPPCIPASSLCHLSSPNMKLKDAYFLEGKF